MLSEGNSRCILCNSENSFISFPYSITFNDSKFDYRLCQDCECVFVDPIPSEDDFKKIYQNESYHEEHYVGDDLSEYKKSARLLSEFINPNQSNVLDYGCGYGHFLKTLSDIGFEALGLEFDQGACLKAEEYSGCSVKHISEFSYVSNKNLQAIHLGDVLEHLPNPRQTLEQLINVLGKKGIIFIEGPLETNPSFVYWSSKVFGYIKKILTSKEQYGEPTHLIKVNERTQLNFILSLDPRIECLHWEVYETGWPYINNGFLRNIIAKFAIFFGGKRFFSLLMGNRFRGIFVIEENN
jgi:SAM-dependent methyltransferase